MRRAVLTELEDIKAEDIVVIGLTGKSDIADYMIVASGRSQRQVGAAIEVVVKPGQGAAILEVIKPAGRRDVDEASLPGCEVKAVSFPAAPGGVFADHPVDDFPAIEVALKPELPAG